MIKVKSNGEIMIKESIDPDLFNLLGAKADHGAVSWDP